MSCRSDEEGDAALLPRGYSTPTKAIHNDGAGHAETDAEGMQTESDADAEKQFDESTGKKRKYCPFLEYRVVKEWPTGEHALLEPKKLSMKSRCS